MVSLARHPPETARHRVTLAALMALYLAVSLNHLAVVPPIHEDEAWQASVGWKLATEGVFGSDMFAGLGHADERYYGFLPVHPLLLAATFRLAGLGLLQARLETVLLGAAVLLLTYALGKRLWGPPVGLLAVAFLLLVRMDATTPMTPTGILFLDGPRISRYDVAVPVFELAALLLFLIARERRSSSSAVFIYGGAGLLAAGAALSHVYGAFWIAVLLVLALWDRAGVRNIAALVVGFLLPCLGYVAYVLQDVAGWTAQTRAYSRRFDLLTPGWYVQNLGHERSRYNPGRGDAMTWILRPGLWLGFGAVAAGLLMLARRARSDFSARVVTLGGILLPILFAALITMKTRNYKMAFLPMWALAAAWLAHEIWSRVHMRRFTRAVLLLLAAAVVIEALGHTTAIAKAAATTTPYARFIQRVHAHVRPGERVLGLHAYWIGLEDTDYHSWYVPTAHIETPPRKGAQLVIGTDPEVVLVDARMRSFLNQSASGDLRAQTVLEWLRPWSLVAVVDDSTYGRMEIYRKR